MQMLKRGFPLLIALAGIVGLAALGAWRIALTPTAMQWPLGLVLVGYAVWILSEFRITTGETKKDVNDDQGTCEAYAISRLLTVVAALAFDPVWASVGIWLPLGVALFVAGIAVRVYAIRTLGKAYSHRVRTPEATGIIASGPYRFMRHPAYTGMLLANAGIVVLFFNYFALLAFALVFVPVLVRRIHVEEAHLFNIPDYQAYATGRARLLPGLW